MAIEMSALCQARAVHAELMEFCTNVVTAQQQERQKMQSWLAGWYDVTKEPQLKATKASWTLNPEPDSITLPWRRRLHAGVRPCFPCDLSAETTAETTGNYRLSAAYHL